MDRSFGIWGGVLAFLGVAAGAFGAHGLKAIVPPELLVTFETGVRYHMYHAFALLLAAVAIPRAEAGTVRLLRAAGWLFVAGIVVFSGSLYLLALSGVRALGMITPLGGAGFLVGWVLLALAARRGTSTP